MHLEFSGAAREVTGSCHILRIAGKTVLLDCGLFQGRRTETGEKNRRLPLPVEQIDAVVLSHAHIDHAGRLPYLVANGYAGPIVTTPATRDLCAIMLADSAHIQEKDAEFLARRGKAYVPPLYLMRDAARAVDLMRSVSYNTPVDVVPGLRVTYFDAGHILGSASLLLECTEGGRSTRLVFSGDVGRAGIPIIRDPQPPPGADVVVMESTYGDREHPPGEDSRGRLAAIVRETAARGGRVIIPAFAVGRTQNLVYELHALHRDGLIPAIPIYIDSPLAVDATSVFAMHPEVFDRTEDLITKVRELFRFELLHYTRDVSESKALNAQHGPMIIISASGMAETGRILHHLAHGAGDHRNTILIVGFQAEHTVGRRIVEKRPFIKVFGEEIPLRAQVEVLDGYSAHAGRSELRAWLDAVRAGARTPPRVHLVHGEPVPQETLAGDLRAAGYVVDAPAPGDRAEL